VSFSAQSLAGSITAEEASMLIMAEVVTVEDIRMCLLGAVEALLCLVIRCLPEATHLLMNEDRFASSRKNVRLRLIRLSIPLMLVAWVTSL
jgi:hypothetical protein